MKMKILLPVLSSVCLIMAGCSKEDEPEVTKVTYNNAVKSVLVTNCAPCHVSGGGNPSKWDDYNTAKSKIDDILERVNRDVSEAGFMPQGGTKLSVSAINILNQWKSDGLLEN